MEISHASAYVVTRCDERVGEYALKSFFESDEAFMSFNQESEDILCSCKKFEEWGFLCRHAIRILDLSFIFKVPKKYILLRWTRDIVTHHVQDTNGCGVQEDVHLDVTERYRHLCPKLVRLADYAAQSKEGYEFVLSQISGWMKAVEIKSADHISILPVCDATTPTCYQGREVKGLAKNVRMNKGGKRLKPWFEKKPKKKSKKEKEKQPNKLAEIHYVKHGVVEMPSNLAMYCDDRFEADFVNEEATLSESTTVITSSQVSDNASPIVLEGCVAENSTTN